MGKKQYSLMLVLALVAGLVGGMVSGQFFIDQPAFAEKKTKPLKVIEAEEFRLVDSTGKRRATLGFISETREPSLWLEDQQGKTRLALRLNASGEPGFVLSDSAGRAGAQLDVTNLAGTEFPHFRLWYIKDANFHVVISPTGISYLEGGLVRCQLRFGAVDDSHLAFFDKHGKTRVLVGFPRDGKTSIRLSDKNGVLRAILGNVRLKDQRGRILERPASSLLLFNEKGKVFWQAP